MKKFTNQNVLKETKNNDKIIIIGIIILLFGIALGLWGGYEIDKTSENAKSFSELLLSDEEKENQNAKLDVTHVPYQFAVQDGNDNSYYIVMDEDYMYVAYMPTSTFNSLNRGLFERQDDVASVAYWYQTHPHAPFAPLMSKEDRWPR